MNKVQWKSPQVEVGWIETRESIRKEEACAFIRDIGERSMSSYVIFLIDNRVESRVSGVSSDNIIQIGRSCSPQPRRTDLPRERQPRCRVPLESFLEIVLLESTTFFRSWTANENLIFFGSDTTLYNPP